MNASPGAGQATQLRRPRAAERRRGPQFSTISSHDDRDGRFVGFHGLRKRRAGAVLRTTNMSDADAKEALQVAEAKEAAEDTPVTTLKL